MRTPFTTAVCTRTRRPRETGRPTLLAISWSISTAITAPSRTVEAVVWQSMGGYGTLRLAMKYPEVYSSIYAMTSCCLMNNPGAVRGGAATPQKQPPAAPVEQNGRGGRGGVFRNLVSAEAAAWSPNPMSPPKFFDLPNEDGVAHAEIVAKWIANSPLAMVDQYVPNLKKQRAIMMDVGLEDNLLNSNKLMDESLSRLGVVHTFETYDGNHCNRVKERFETKVLPFFSENLEFLGRQANR